MTQTYSNPKHTNDPNALPGLEVWADFAVSIDCAKCGVLTLPADHVEYSYSDGAGVACPECKTETEKPLETSPHPAWWFWYCFPGGLPDSDVRGPFASEAAALAEAQEEETE